MNMTTRCLSKILACCVLLLVCCMPATAGIPGDTDGDTNISADELATAILGYLGGSFSNAVIMALLKHATQGKWLWVRTIGSTLVGELVDTAVFIAVGALTRVFPWELFLTLTLTNYLFKVAIEVIMTPATYWVTNRLKKAENLDTYSDLSDLSPLSF